MNCSRDLIEAYMDEELDPGLRAAVEEHLFKLPGLLRNSLAIPRTASQYQVNCPLLHGTGPIAAIGPQGAAAGGSR